MGNIVSTFTGQSVKVYASLQKSDVVLHSDKPWWSMVILSLCIIPFLLLSTMIDYTYAEIIEALAIIESPPSSISLQSLARQDTEKERTKKHSLREAPRKQQPITTSLAATVRHLHAHNGYLWPFRGFLLWCIHRILQIALSALFHRFFIRHELDKILATICISTVHMTWLHMVISKSTTEFWFERLQNRRIWTQIALPTAVLVLAHYITVLVPAKIFTHHIEGLDADSLINMSYQDRSLFILNLFCMIFLALFLGMTVYLPAKVIVTRVYASVLPSTVETIVPFDRTFGGRVSPNGADTIGMVDAWRTFSGHSKVNLLMVHLKIMAIQTSLKVVSLILQTIHMHFIQGIELSEISSQLTI